MAYERASLLKQAEELRQRRRQDLHNATVPVGTQSVSYAIKAKRGNQSSEWSEALTLRFGRAGGGLTITSSVTTPTTPVKLAA